MCEDFCDDFDGDFDAETEDWGDASLDDEGHEGIEFPDDGCPALAIEDAFRNCLQ